MKTTIVAFIIMIANQAYSHGLIEKLECQDKKGNVKINATEAKKEFTPKGKALTALDIKLNNNKKLKNYETVAISMEDEVKGKKVIEHLTFTMGETKAHLTIPETPGEKNRKGLGEITLAKNKTVPVNCSVLYE